MTSRTAQVPETAGMTAVGVTTAGVTADVEMAGAQTVPGKTPATPTRRSWRPSRTRSIPDTGTPAALTHAAHVRGRPTCPWAPHELARSATCRARLARRVRHDRRRGTRPPPTTVPGRPPRAPRPVPAAPGLRPALAPGPLALVPGNRGRLVFGQARGLPMSRTIPPSPATPHRLSHGRPAPRRPATGARKRTRPGGRSMRDCRQREPSRPTPRAAIRTGPRRPAGSSTAERPVAAR